MEPPPTEPPPMEPPPDPPVVEAASEPAPPEPATPVYEPPPMVESPPMAAPPLQATPLEPLPLEPAPTVDPAAGEGIETPTMAELYASQGHFDKAVNVYRNLLARDPNETQYLERIEELEMLAKASADSQASSSPATPPEARGDRMSDSGRQQTIEVLEKWLDEIRRTRRA